MSQPPRRSRPKRPGQTIDLKAERSGTVGYAGPVSSEAAAAAAPEDRLADAATSVSDPLPAPVPAGVDPDVPVGASSTDEIVAAAGAGVPSTEGEAASTGDATLRDFAEDEGLVDPDQRDKTAEAFEDETILAAATPDAAARAAAQAAAKPQFDYHAASALTQPEHHGGGFGTALGAALLGALLALGGAGAAQYAGLLPGLARQDPAVLTQQFASVGDVQQVTADFATLREDVERLKSAQAAGGAGVGATTADLNAVVDRVTAIEQRAGQAPAVAAVDPGAVDAVRTAADEAKRLAEDAKRAADAATGAVAAIRQTAEGAVQTAGNAQSVAGNAVQSSETAQQTATTAQAAATAAQQAAATAQSTAGSAGSAVAALEPRLAAMEASSRQAAVSIAAASLKSAIDEGTPFMGQLERFAQVAGSSPAVATLRGFAASGVPSKASLAAAWPSVEASIAEALRPAPAAGDVGGQVLSGLSALVTVRPSGPAPASAQGSDAALSRLSAAIASGDLGGFLTEWETLPEAGKTASADFQARVKARAEAEQVIGQTLDAAVQAVGTAG